MVVMGQTIIDGQVIGQRGVLSGTDTFEYQPHKLEVEYCQKIYNDVLPNGRLWEAFGQDGTIDYAISSSAGAMLAVALAYLEYVRKELNIDTTVDLISDWETSVGLPDECSVKLTSLEQRRAQVKARLKHSPTVTPTQFEAIIKELTGYNVKVRPRMYGGSAMASQYDSGVFDYAAFSSDRADRFIFDVFIDYSDAANFGIDCPAFDGADLFDGAAKPNFISCVIEKIKPSNSIAVYHFDSYLYEVTQ